VEHGEEAIREGTGRFWGKGRCWAGYCRIEAVECRIGRLGGGGRARKTSGFEIAKSGGGRRPGCTRARKRWRIGRKMESRGG